MSLHTQLKRLFKWNVAFELAIEQLDTPTGYYLCKHTLVEQYPDLTVSEKMKLLEKITEQIERSDSSRGPITKQHWLYLEQQLSH
ncbi:hypothetical protein [Exiguobacterium sp. s193]|uniref:hypothetical protein n=1 Tax=Exiguobacterium sp. s193 TaxID=2751207 RepID=UPI001BE6FB7C|nr:hypothetical protein [Exiguobacterium sp. s193]